MIADNSTLVGDVHICAFLVLAKRAALRSAGTIPHLSEGKLFPSRSVVHAFIHHWGSSVRLTFVARSKVEVSLF